MLLLILLVLFLLQRRVLVRGGLVAALLQRCQRDRARVPAGAQVGVGSAVQQEAEGQRVLGRELNGEMKIKALNI